MNFLKAVKAVSTFFKGEDHDWKIVGNLRSGGTEIVYEGTDYCNVSDYMLNPGEPDEKYMRMRLFQDGVLIEDVSPPMPRGSA